MKRALILGTNAGQADIIEYLKDTGWEVHACGHKRIGPGCDLAHFFHMVNTVDAEAVKELAKKIRADIVYSVSSDSAIRSCTKVSEELDLPRFLNSEIIDLFHFKDKIRKFMNDNNINTVIFKRITKIEQIEDWKIFPCVVKPTDSQGQRGVQLIREKGKLQESVEHALEQSSTGTVIIEEFLEGIEISTNMVVQDHNIIVNEFTERLVHGYEFFGLPKGHSIPVRKVDEKTLDLARATVIELVRKMNISDAVLYIQMKVTRDGPKIIEIAPRLDGCHIWRLIKIAKGYDLRQYAIDCLTGKKIAHQINETSDPYTLAFYQLRTGTIFSPDKLEIMDNNLYNEFRYKPNEKILPINGSLEVVGYYVKSDS